MTIKRLYLVPTNAECDQPVSRPSSSMVATLPTHAEAEIIQVDDEASAATRDVTLDRDLIQPTIHHYFGGSASDGTAVSNASPVTTRSRAARKKPAPADAVGEPSSSSSFTHSSTRHTRDHEGLKGVKKQVKPEPKSKQAPAAAVATKDMSIVRDPFLQRINDKRRK